jgi:hypothetical protein
MAMNKRGIMEVERMCLEKGENDKNKDSQSAVLK